jgi:hypothetical protein
MVGYDEIETPREKVIQTEQVYTFMSLHLNCHTLWDPIAALTLKYFASHLEVLREIPNN